MQPLEAGDIYRISFRGTGPELTGPHYAAVVSDGAFNDLSTVVVVPFGTTINVTQDCPASPYSPAQSLILALEATQDGNAQGGCLVLPKNLTGPFTLNVDPSQNYSFSTPYTAPSGTRYADSSDNRSHSATRHYHIGNHPGFRKHPGRDQPSIGESCLPLLECAVDGLSDPQ